MHATIPKGNMGYDQHTVPDDCSCRTYFGCFPLALTNLCPWPPVPFFQISLQNGELKTIHNTFRDCRVHFFRPHSESFLETCIFYIRNKLNILNVFWFLQKIRTCSRSYYTQPKFVLITIYVRNVLGQLGKVQVLSRGLLLYLHYSLLNCC